METLIIDTINDTETDIFNRTISISNNTEEEITDIIIDSFNEQVQLGKAFNKKIESFIHKKELNNQIDVKKIQNAINTFIESSQKLLGDYMKKTLDIQQQYNAIEPNDIRKNLFKMDGINSLNNQWMKDWVEQNDSYKTGNDTFPLYNNYEDEYCHYVDVSDLN